MDYKFISSQKIKQLKIALFFISFFSFTSVHAQESNSVTGVVTDNEKIPLFGVQINEKNTKNYTSTDVTGKYTLKLGSKNSTIIVSYLGFSKKEIEVSANTVVNVTLQGENQLLKEITVVGYGTVKKTDLTGSVNTVNSQKITERNVTSPLGALQGSMPGVQISSNTGRVGDGFNVVIRGNNSLSGSKPLFIIDGVPADGIDFLNPQDIARIDVLKDASSAAIYGSRGGSGVIIVTTKNGSTSKAGFNVSFETSYGVKETARLPKLMDGEKWWLYHQSAFLFTSIPTTPAGQTYMDVTPTLLNNGVSASGSNNLLFQRVANNKTFDWYNAVLKPGITQNNYLNISGRSESGLSYNLGIGIQKETGNIDNEGIDKYSFKAGINHKINEKFSFGTNLTLAKTDQQQGSPVAMQEAFRLAPFMSPWAIDAGGNEIVGTYALQPGTLRYPNGTLAINKTGTLNPLLEIANSKDETTRWTTLGNLFAEYKATKWLSFKSNFSGGITNARQGKSFGAQTNVGLNNKNLSSGEITNNQNFNFTWDNQFNINYTLKEDHVFSFLGLQSIFSNTSESSFLSSRENPVDTGFYNLGSGYITTQTVASNYSKNTLNSFAARLNYTYKGRYLLTASTRYDGSSVLSAGNKWTSFPSVALGWKVNEESFMKNLKFISALKLRASLGYTGNNTVPAYSSLSLLKLPTYYEFNNTLVNGITSNNLVNPELTWEKTKELNYGVDFGFLRNRITGSVDLYDRLSEGLLYKQTLPLETGIPFITSNVGSISNKGIEVALTTKNIQTKNVSWETSFTFTKNVNKLMSIYNQTEKNDVGNNLFIGENINSLYNFVFDGIWQESERALAATYNQKPGEARVKDLNNDGKIDAVNDRTILGNTDPKWSGSFSSTLRVKQFDLSFNIITNQGVTVFSQFHNNFADVNDRGRQKLDLADWYIPENGAGIPAQYSNTNPIPRAAGVYYTDNRVAFYKDASFVKVQNISLGYTFSNDLVDRLKIKSFRVYVNVLNPFVITNYEGYDPEWAASSFAVGRVSSITGQIGVSLKI
jgi:TonB-dependent starch-binding outer membrane protein SusC